MTLSQLWSIFRGRQTNFRWANASWTYYPNGDPMSSTYDFPSDNGPCENTDREIWRGPDEGNGDYYADSVFITKEGALGINCGGSVHVRPIRDWHRLAGGPIVGLPKPDERGGPTEANPDRPYCKPDGSCCDFCCGN